MKLRFTSKDYILMLGILIAAIIAFGTFFNRQGIVKTKSTVTNQVQASNHAAVMLQNSIKIYLSIRGKVSD